MVSFEKYGVEDGCAKVWLYTVSGGGHDWPGAYGNMDIDSSREAWLFFDSLCASTCIEDLDSDGYITIQDLLLILSDFGCVSSCENDITEDGFVSVYDVLIVLSGFGNACE